MHKLPRYHVLPADILVHFGFSSVSVESLYIQVHHHKLTLGDNDYRYDAYAVTFILLWVPVPFCCICRGS